MTDYFALLRLPRRPWLDPARLKAAFLELSPGFHPDRVHELPETERAKAHQAFTELNQAYACLREPKDRLSHLLLLETGEPPQDVQRIPPDTMNLFFEIGKACREADAFLANQGGPVSSILKANRFQQSLMRLEQLEQIKTRLDTKSQEVVSELQEMNRLWEAADAMDAERRREFLPLRRLEQIFRDLSYLSRWSSQLNQRILQLNVDQLR